MQACINLYISFLQELTFNDSAFMCIVWRDIYIHTHTYIHSNMGNKDCEIIMTMSHILIKQYIK